MFNLSVLKVKRNVKLDFKNLGEGKGIHHPTIRNDGNTSVMLQNVDVLEPGKTFKAELPGAITDESFDVKFIRDDSLEEPKNEIIIWYGVKNCE